MVLNFPNHPDSQVLVNIGIQDENLHICYQDAVDDGKQKNAKIKEFILPHVTLTWLA